MRNIMAAICTASFGILLILLVIIGLHKYRAVQVGNDTEPVFDSAAETEIQTVLTETEPGQKQASQEPVFPVLVLESSAEKETAKAEKTEVSLLFAGDICLQEYIAEYYDRDGINGVVSPELQEMMQTADIMMVNQEFAFSERGTPMEDKQYTFEIAPRYTSVFTDLGIDIVTLANNHTLDYGQEALLDSFDALDKAGIPYVGAGKNLERAKQMEIFEINGIKIGFLAASRVIPVTEWNAGKDTPGMLTTYDPTALLAEIEEGKKYCDFVIVYVHWGVERNEFPEEYQTIMAKQYIDAGADAVIGSHPHVMQGIELYKNKIIAYSLGNYIFSPRTGKGAMLRLTVKKDGTQEAMLEPFQASAFPVTVLESQKQSEFYRYMEQISFGISIDEDGRICYTQTN